MIEASGDLLHLDQGRDERRHGSLRGRPVAELASVVPAPTPDGAVFLHGASVRLPRADLNNSGKIRDAKGSGTEVRLIPREGCRSIAELAVQVVSPAKDASIGVEGARVSRGSRCDLCRVVEADDSPARYRSGRADTELPDGIFAPTVNRAPLPQHAIEGSASGDLERAIQGTAVLDRDVRSARLGRACLPVHIANRAASVRDGTGHGDGGRG
jgi:hypothetical protein